MDEYKGRAKELFELIKKMDDVQDKLMKYEFRQASEALTDLRCEAETMLTAMSRVKKKKR